MGIEIEIAFCRVFPGLGQGMGGGCLLRKSFFILRGVRVATARTPFIGLAFETQLQASLPANILRLGLADGFAEFEGAAGGQRVLQFRRACPTIVPTPTT